MIQTLNALGDDAYFIQDVSMYDHYIHHPIEVGEDVHFPVGKGLEMACIFKKKNAQNFLKLSGQVNLRLVKVTDVLPDDNSRN